MRVLHKGAMITVKTMCNNHHEMEWESSPCFGAGKHRVAIINVLIAAYCLLTGLHIKQVGKTEHVHNNEYIILLLPGAGFFQSLASVLFCQEFLLQPADLSNGACSLACLVN